MFDTPCTQALWQAVMGENPSHFKVADRPVESVSWEQCREFLTALNSRLDGVQLSLPSEAQWEYACRAGTETARYSENLDAIAWYDENSGNETHPVARKKANPWGLYDMLGNVWEWCKDVWVEDYTEKSRAAASADSASAHRVIRGGSWVYDAMVRARGVPQPRRALAPVQRPGLPLCRVQAGGRERSEAEERGGGQLNEQGDSHSLSRGRERSEAGERGGGCGATRRPRPDERAARPREDDGLSAQSN